RREEASRHRTPDHCRTPPSRVAVVLHPGSADGERYGCGRKGVYDGWVHPGDCIAARFGIESEAGSGGMAEGYRAHDRFAGGTVALKLLTAQARLSAGRLSHEGRILANFVHPNVVRYVAHGETAEGRPFLALEWLDGETLAARLLRSPLSVVET